MKVKLNIVKHNHFSFSFFQKCEENLTIQICNNRNSSTKQKLIISVKNTSAAMTQLKPSLHILQRYQDAVFTQFIQIQFIQYCSTDAGLQ